MRIENRALYSTVTGKFYVKVQGKNAGDCDQIKLNLRERLRMNYTPEQLSKHFGDETEFFL